jgi:hypothetical protein
MLNRPTMVVPGPVPSAESIGHHAELPDHPQTRLVRDSADNIADLTTQEPAAHQRRPRRGAHLPGAEK